MKPTDEDDEPEWADEKPMTEEQAEKLHADCDQLADRIQARLDREGPDADFDRILDEELERRAKERGYKPLTPEQEQERAEWIEEANRAAEEALNNPDPELEAELNARHPIAKKASDLAVRVARDTNAHAWLPHDACREHPVAELEGAILCAAAKFAGALNGEWPPPVDFAASNIVRLKRARGYLEDASLAAVSCREEKLIPVESLEGIERDVRELLHACDEIIAELRARIARGFD